jgi:hypothetical protein
VKGRELLVGSEWYSQQPSFLLSLLPQSISFQICMLTKVVNVCHGISPKSAVLSYSISMIERLHVILLQQVVEIFRAVSPRQLQRCKMENLMGFNAHAIISRFIAPVPSRRSA